MENKQQQVVLFSATAIALYGEFMATRNALISAISTLYTVVANNILYKTLSETYESTNGVYVSRI